MPPAVVGGILKKYNEKRPMKKITLLFTLMLAASIMSNAQPAKQENHFTKADSIFNVEVLAPALKHHKIFQAAAKAYQQSKSDSILQASYMAQVDSIVYVEKTISKGTWNRRKIFEGKQRVWVEQMVDAKPPVLRPVAVSQQSYNTWIEQKRKELLK